MSVLHAVKELRYEALFILAEREKYIYGKTAQAGI
jgi:hypothetical protein